LRLTVNGDEYGTLPFHSKVWHEVAKTGGAYGTRILNLHVVHQRAARYAKSPACNSPLNCINIFRRSSHTSKHKAFHLEGANL
jgi:hypothetical protein